MFKYISKTGILLGLGLFCSQVIIGSELPKSSETKMVNVVSLAHLPQEVLWQMILSEDVNTAIKLIKNLLVVSKTFKASLEKETFKKLFVKKLMQSPTPLSYAVLLKEPKLLKMLLDPKINNQFNKLNKNEKTKDGMTPLLLAIKNNWAEMAKMLVQFGVNVNQEYKGHTPLLLAIENNLTEIAKILVRFGADVNQGYQGHTPLMWAVQNNNIDLVKFLLQQKGIDVKAVAPGAPRAIDRAIANGNLDILKLLWKKGKEKLLLDYWLSKAIKENHLEIVKYLIESGVTPNKEHLSKAKDAKTYEYIYFQLVKTGQL